MNENFTKMVKGTWINLRYIRWISMDQDDEDGIYVYGLDNDGIRHIIVNGFTVEEQAHKYMECLLLHQKTPTMTDNGIRWTCSICQSM
jgi:hypothetical protein